MLEQINYPELGGTANKSVFHTDGSEFIHPSGAIYKRINGNWVLISRPETKTEEEN
jgi:hypothetical protein